MTNTVPTPQPSQASLDAVALELARAYWRGQIEASMPKAPTYVVAPMVEAAAREQVVAFRSSARTLLCQIGHTEPVSP